MTTATLHANSQATATKDRAEILSLVDALHQAHHRKDAAAIVASYAKDAAVFSLAPPLAHEGVDVMEKQRWLDSWETPVELESRNFEVSVSGDLAFCYGFLQLSGTKKGPEGRVRFWMRETMGFERRPEGWRIVHEHASVPFYMDGSLRPAFDLEP